MSYEQRLERMGYDPECSSHCSSLPQRRQHRLFEEYISYKEAVSKPSANTLRRCWVNGISLWLHWLHAAVSTAVPATANADTNATAGATSTAYCSTQASVEEARAVQTDFSGALTIMPTRRTAISTQSSSAFKTGCAGFRGHTAGCRCRKQIKPRKRICQSSFREVSLTS